MSDPREPTFLGIGAPKSGTTYLWHVLRSHPDIQMPDRKELTYFNVEGMEELDVPNPLSRRPLEWYLAHFEPGPAVRGEVSPIYLSSRSAPRRIAEELPGCRKFVAILREPAARALSDFRYRKQRGTLAPGITLREALAADATLLERSRYGSQLERWFDVFDPASFLILPYEALSSADQLSASLGTFLDVDPAGFQPPAERRNETGRARYPRVNRALAVGSMWAKRRGLGGVRERLAATPLGAGLARVRRETVATLDPGSADGSIDELRIAHEALEDELEILRRLLPEGFAPWL